MDKIFTYQIQYNGNDGFNSIRFCAKNMPEAKKLFYIWCKTDMGLNRPYEITEIKTVYDEADAKEYGENYGIPPSMR